MKSCLSKTILMCTALVFLFLLGIQGQVAAFNYSEDFEAWPPTGWTLYQLGTGTDNWDRAAGGHAGSYAAFHDDFSGWHNSWLVSPAITLPATGTLTLSFYEKNEYVPNWYDYSGVYISTGSGDPAVGNFVELYESNQTILNWTKKNIDISSYAGQTVYIAFNLIGDFAHEWWIDYMVVRDSELEEQTLTTSSAAGGSVVLPGESSYTYERATIVNVSAVPDALYQFTGWSGTAVDAGKVADASAASTTVTLDGDYTLVAEFQSNYTTLTTSSTANGSVTTPGEGSYDYTRGTVVSVTAIPDALYQFAGWTGTAVDAGKVADVSAASTTVTLDDAYTLTAGFELEDVTITGPPAVDAGGVAQYTAAGLTGDYEWTVSDGSFELVDPLDSTVIEFTAPQVTEGSTTVTITARDTTYNDVVGTQTVTVYAPPAINEMPAGYEADPETGVSSWPVLHGVTSFTALDETRAYRWTATDWNGTPAPIGIFGDTYYDGRELQLDPNQLLYESGAGVYTITLSDRTNPSLAEVSIKVRVPMRITFSSIGLESQDTETRGISRADESNVLYTNNLPNPGTFRVVGGPRGMDDYFYSAFDVHTGSPVTNETCGEFVQTSPTYDSVNFDFNDAIDTAVSFRVAVHLSEASDDPEAVRLVEAGLSEVQSDIFTVIPVVQYTGTVRSSDSLEVIEGAVVASTNDPFNSDTTDILGQFTVTWKEVPQVVEQFSIQHPDFVTRTVTSEKIQAGPIDLEPIGVGGSISGTVSLDTDVLMPGVSIRIMADQPVLVTAKTDSGDYVLNADGEPLTVPADLIDGSYAFTIPSGYADAGPFDLEFKKPGYIFDPALGEGVLNDIALDTIGNDIVLSPVTAIFVTGAWDPDAGAVSEPSVSIDGDPDTGSEGGVSVVITAKPAFTGAASEISVSYASGAAVSGLEYHGIDNAWHFVHEVDEDFSINVSADTSSEVPDAESGYFAEKQWQYIKSTGSTEMTTLPSAAVLGGKVVSGSGGSKVELVPGSLSGTVKGNIYLMITEMRVTEDGAGLLSSPDIVEVVMTDEDGNVITGRENDDIDRIWITMTFDPTLITEGMFENGEVAIYQADDPANLMAGNASAVPYDGSWIIDYKSGRVTFWVNHLSAFGVGDAQDGGQSGSGCFINSAVEAGGSVIPLILFFSGVAIAAAIRAKRRKGLFGAAVIKR